MYKNLQQEIANQAYLYPIVDNQKILAVNKRVGNVNDAKLVPIYTFWWIYQKLLLNSNSSGK